MPARRKRRTPKKKTSAKTGHTLEKGFDDFGKEMETLGKRLEKKVDDNGKCMNTWFNTTFGVVGPLISSLIGIVILAAFLWVLNMASIPLGIGLLQNIHYFMMVHIGWFFLIFLFFSYTSYISGNFPRTYRPISPLVSSAGITIALWIAANAIKVVNISLQAQVLTNLSSFIEGSLMLFFYLFALIGYLVLLAQMVTNGHFPSLRTVRTAETKIASKTPARTKRLYRSGNDRILGGVCGGIAEHLGIDPVLIRLIWIVGTLAWGFGILVYIIMWIITPRNPNHKWKG